MASRPQLAAPRPWGCCCPRTGRHLRGRRNPTVLVAACWAGGRGRQASKHSPAPAPAPPCPTVGRRQAHVSQARVELGIQEHVGGLDVPVQHGRGLGGVQGGQRGSRLGGDAQPRLPRQRRRPALRVFRRLQPGCPPRQAHRTAAHRTRPLSWVCLMRSTRVGPPLTRQASRSSRLPPGSSSYTRQALASWRQLPNRRTRWGQPANRVPSSSTCARGWGRGAGGELPPLLVPPLPVGRARAHLVVKLGLALQAVRVHHLDGHGRVVQHGTVHLAEPALADDGQGGEAARRGAQLVERECALRHRGAPPRPVARCDPLSVGRSESTSGSS